MAVVLEHIAESCRLLRYTTDPKLDYVVSEQTYFETSFS